MPQKDAVGNVKDKDIVRELEDLVNNPPGEVIERLAKRVNDANKHLPTGAPGEALNSRASA